MPATTRIVFFTRLASFEIRSVQVMVICCAARFFIAGSVLLTILVLGSILTRMTIASLIFISSASRGRRRRHSTTPFRRTSSSFRKTVCFRGARVLLIPVIIWVIIDMMRTAFRVVLFIEIARLIFEGILVTRTSGGRTVSILPLKLLERLLFFL